MQKITSFFKVSSPRTVPNDQWTINGIATYSSQDIISPSGENLSEPEISALSSPEVDQNENLENESQNEIRQPVLRTRKFRNKWKTEFPWIKMVDSNLVICTICEASEFGNDQLKVLYEFYVEAINLNWEDLLSEWNIFK
uniref:Uncharacterized protein n=1 Tax=Romanomermis culicivorax TaxID=13658 RepID=A0A915HQD4_ROMCU